MLLHESEKSERPSGAEIGFQHMRQKGVVKSAKDGKTLNGMWCNFVLAIILRNLSKFNTVTSSAAKGYFSTLGTLHA